MGSASESTKTKKEGSSLGVSCVAEKGAPSSVYAQPGKG